MGDATHFSSIMWKGVGLEIMRRELIGSLNWMFCTKIVVEVSWNGKSFQIWGNCYIQVKDHRDQHSLLILWNKLPWWFVDNKLRNMYWDSSPKYENSVINNSHGTCCSKAIRSLSIFGTQIKIFLRKSMTFLTLHRQQQNYHVQGPETYQGHR